MPKIKLTIDYYLKKNESISDSESSDEDLQLFLNLTMCRMHGKDAMEVGC